MAAPTYATDLADITLAESTTNWTALGGGASGLAIGPDFAMQGTNCVDKQVTGAEKGHIFNFGSTITPATNTHFFVWVFLATPGLANTLANRGLACILGTATTAYVAFHVEGSDTYGAAGRVAKCYPVRYVTTSSGSPPYRTLTGSPGANPQYFGATTNITGTVKGSNLGVDAIRHGTGIYITAGTIADGRGTFSGAATQNDTINNRWGILTATGGSNYELQGRFVVGQNTAGTPTVAEFADSNKSILIVNTPHTLTDFTQIIIDHASTVFNLTSITIEAAGTNNPGRLVYNNASTVSALTGCTFIGLGISTLRAGVTADNCTWRRTGAITQNSAVIQNSLITENSATSALLLDDSTKISNTTFVSDGTGHAIEGFSTAGSYSLSDLTFTGYAGSNGSTGNEAIFVTATTGTVTLTVDGGNTPSIRTAGATVVLVVGAVTASVTTITTTGTPIQNVRVLVYAAAGGSLPAAASITISNSGTTATVTHVGHSLSTNDKVMIRGASHWQNNGVFSITVTGNDTYTYTLPTAPGSNPTGTITSTFVVLFGLTDVNGNITMTRTFPADQPIVGRARKSSSADNPKYKTSPVAGIVDSTGGFSTVIAMIDDQ